MSRTVRGVVVSMLITGLLAGCTKTRETKVARLYEPAAESTEVVRYGGEYVAKWRRAGGKGLRTIPGTTVAANKGDRLGFARTDDGQLIAIHGEQRFPIKAPPAEARYVVWHNQATVQTQFGKEMEELGDGSVEVLKVVGTGAFIVGLLWLAAEHEDDCDCEDHHLHFTFDDDD